MKQVSGQVKNTVKDIISVLRGHYEGGEKPDDPSIIRNTIESERTPEFWKDWRWQIRHAIRDIATVEQVLGIRFNREEREQLQKTIDKFPLNITPYYISLIDVNDYQNDPIFKQAFPSPNELIIENYELSDPLAEDKDSPCTASRTGIRTGYCSLSAIPVRCTAGIAPGNERSAMLIRFPNGKRSLRVLNTSGTPRRYAMCCSPVVTRSCSPMITWTGYSPNSVLFLT